MTSVVNDLGQKRALVVNNDGSLKVSSGNYFLAIPLSKNITTTGEEVAGGGGAVPFHMPEPDYPITASKVAYGRGFVKISDYDLFSQAKRGRINVVYAPTTAQGNPTNFSYHLVGFNDDAETITSGNTNIDVLTPASFGKADVLGDMNQLPGTKVNLLQVNVDGTNRNFYSNISDSFDIAHENYYLRFDNTHSGQPNMPFFVTLYLYN